MARPRRECDGLRGGGGSADFARRPSRARAAAPRHRWSRPSRRTRCAGPAARRDSRRCRRRRPPSRAAPRSSSAPRAALRRAASANQSSTILRQTEVQERIVSSRSQEVDPRRALDPARDRREIAPRQRAISAVRPPIASAHFRPSIASSTHSIEGVLMVSPLKIAFAELAAFGQAEDLRQRPGRRVALQPLDRARAERRACRAPPRRPAPSARTR